MTEDAVKGIQTALWAALVLVQMGVVGCLEVRAETVHREVTYEAVEMRQRFRRRLWFLSWQAMTGNSSMSGGGLG